MSSAPTEESRWIPRIALEAAHAAQVREHGGRPGLRDEGALESALSRPRNRWHHEDASDLATLAAAYGYGLASNHPFLDGNERIALVAMNVFLILNGHEIEAPEPEVVDAMIKVADGTLDEDALTQWLRSVIVPSVP